MHPISAHLCLYHINMDLLIVELSSSFSGCLAAGYLIYNVFYHTSIITLSHYNITIIVWFIISLKNFPSIKGVLFDLIFKPIICSILFPALAITELAFPKLVAISEELTAKLFETSFTASRM